MNIRASRSVGWRVSGGTAAVTLNAPDKTDTELVRHARAGREDALEALARRHRRGAYLFALQLTGNQDDAMDVAQEAMLRFFGSLRRFDAERPVRPWLLRIVRNLVTDLWRHRGVRQEEPLEGDGDLSRQVADPLSDPQRDAERAELRRKLWRVLSELPQPLREILVLRDYHDLTYAEIAATLGVPSGTVMSRLHRARRELRSRLESWEDVRWIDAAKGADRA